MPEDMQTAENDETAKSPDQKFWMDCKKDKIGNFERGCSQSNHRKVTDFGLLQDFKRMIMTFGSRVENPVFRFSDSISRQNPKDPELRTRTIPMPQSSR